MAKEDAVSIIIQSGFENKPGIGADLAETSLRDLSASENMALGIQCHDIEPFRSFPCENGQTK